MMLHTKRVLYSPGRIICLQLLQSACCETFEELFNLIKNSRARRKEAEYAKERYLPDLLEEHPSVLKTIGSALARAEKSRQSRHESLDYELRLQLGHTFSARKEDFWLAEYFYLSSYTAVASMEVKDGRKMIQALERLGYIKESKGSLQEALNLLEEAFQIAEEHGLEMTDIVRQSLYLITHRICMTLGINIWKTEQIDIGSEVIDPRNSEAFRFFKRAQEMALFANTRESQAAAHAKIGEVMLSLNKCDAAISHFKKFLCLCEKSDDKLGLCNGYLALSAAYENIGEVQVAKDNLQHCLEMAVKENLFTALVPCCIAIGKLETDLKNYSEASEQFEMAFNLLRSNRDLFKDCISIEKLARILCGVGRAHLHIDEFTDTLRKCTVPGIVKIIKWKTRSLGFGEMQIPRDFAS